MKKYDDNFNLIGIHPVKVENFDFLKKEYGVYIITENFNNEEFITYVGRSKNIRSRILNHNIIRQTKKENTFNSVYILYSTSENYISIEQKLLCFLKPLRNSQNISIGWFPSHLFN